MKFIKVHGCGNDALLVDAIDDTPLARWFEPSRAGVAGDVRAMCARTTGVGADVVIVLTPAPKGADVDCTMLVYNSDGSSAEMCSTGVRAAARHLLTRRRVLKESYRILTGAGVLNVRVTDRGAMVRMGRPIFALRDVPADAARLGVSRDEAIEIPLPPDIRSVLSGPCGSGGSSGIHRMSVASMGNPHAIFWCEALRAADVPLSLVGPVLEHNAAFPQRANVHFVDVRSREHVVVRTWERGAGATLACGTGACAIVAAGVRANRLERTVRVDVPGGVFTITWDQADNQMVLEGAIEDICTGEWTHPAASAIGPADWPEIVTPRLRLRPPRVADAERIAELANLRELAEMTLTVPHPYAASDAVQWIAGMGERVRTGRGREWLITRSGVEGPAAVVGAVGLGIDPAHRWAELGYWIGKDFWGAGYATEAARAVLEHAFAALGLQRIQAHFMTINPASGRVLEKIGMRREGVLESRLERFGVRRDSVVMAMTRQAWEARR